MEKEEIFIRLDDILKITENCLKSIKFEEHTLDFREGVRWGILTLFQRIEEECPKYGGAWVKDDIFDINMTTDEILEKFTDFINKG